MNAGDPRRRIVVLGAGGFIGERITSALSARDWAEPVATGRRARPGVQAVDATDSDSLRGVLAGAHGVVNCVAGDAATIRDNALALAAAVGGVPQAPRIVHLSSMAVYGSATGEVDEASPARGDGGWYSAAKLEAEVALLRLPDVVILRPGCVYGPGSPQWTLRIARALQAHRLGDLGARGDGACNLVHVDDVVQAVLAALRRPGVAGEIFNLSAPLAPTWNEYLVRYARALQAVPVMRIGRRRLQIEGRLLAPPLKVAELVARAARLRVTLPPPLPPSLLRQFGQDLRLSSRKAGERLQIEWMPLERGLAQAADWVRGAG